MVASGIPRFDAVFASDVHLSAAHPETTAAFLAFVDAAVAGRTMHFFILGDLFEYWLGDDDVDDAVAAALASRLRQLQDDGVEVFFQHGNRDFLVGVAFAEAARMTILPDPHPVRIGGLALLLSHGDALCTDDVDYQHFRTMVRNPAFQQGFLAKTLDERRAIGRGARAQSEAAKQGKDAAIMDVNESAVVALLESHPDTTLIHGHTHRPARHRHRIADVERQRVVLDDWDAEAHPPRGGGIAIVDGRIVTLTMAGEMVD